MDIPATNFEQVMEFHRKFGDPPTLIPSVPTDEVQELRWRLLDEEYLEVSDELGKPEINIYALAKEIADLLYVTYGLGLAFGLDMDAVFAEVHRSNMSKLGPDGKPILREDGKFLKGPNYTPADIETVVDFQ